MQWLHGSKCCRRPVIHQRTSVLSAFNCSLLETTPMHSESYAENASISTGQKNRTPECRQRKDVVKDHCPPSMTSDRRCTKWITGDPTLTLEAHHSPSLALVEYLRTNSFKSFVVTFGQRDRTASENIKIIYNLSSNICNNYCVRCGGWVVSVSLSGICRFKSPAVPLFRRIIALSKLFICIYSGQVSLSSIGVDKLASASAEG